MTNDRHWERLEGKRKDGRVLWEDWRKDGRREQKQTELVLFKVASRARVPDSHLSR